MQAPMTIAQKAATAAASVGVKMPPQMPPSSTTGSVNGITARPSTRGSSDNGVALPNGRPRRLPTHATMNIRLTASSNPGTTPARNSAPTDAPLRIA